MNFIQGTTQTNLSLNIYNEREPKYSRDGRKIYLMNFDGSSQTNLSSNEFNEREPKYSRDGRKILYLSDKNAPSGQYCLWLMDRDGSNKKQLTTDSTYNAYWSDDGLDIAFTKKTISGTTSYSAHTVNLLTNTITDIPRKIGFIDTNQIVRGWINSNNYNRGYIDEKRLRGVLFSPYVEYDSYFLYDFITNTVIG